MVCLGKAALESVRLVGLCHKKLHYSNWAKTAPVNNDIVRHKGLCGSGTGDLFHCKQPLFKKRKKKKKSKPDLHVGK